MGERIRKARKAKGLTQLELSNLTGMEGSTVRHYELGRRTPSDVILARIAEALGVSVEALMNLSPSTDREAVEMLFRLEEECRCRPQVSEGGVSVSFDDAGEELRAMVTAWSKQLALLDSGQITEEDYAAWKASFKG
ncbi:MAG: helix-turn-helix domain-containing protein [Coriobacteriales bacterium]